MKNKILFLLLFVMTTTSLLAVDIWDGITKTAFSTANNAGESAANPILISSGAHLAYLSDMVNASNVGTTVSANPYKDVFFKLTTDIDLNKKEWYPIGWHITNAKNRHFQGNFDGDGHLIKNLKISTAKMVTEGNISYYGLFGACRGGAITNLGVEGVIKAALAWTAGGITALADGMLIENCYSRVEISVNNHAGGIAATVNQSAGGQTMTIRNCYFAGLIAVGGNKKNIGGIVAISNKARIENCYNVGKVTCSGTEPVMGAIAGTTLSAVNCYYLTDCITVNNTYGIAKSEIELKSADMITLLNSEQITSPWIKGFNNGFPMLSWENKTITGADKILNDSAPIVGYNNGKAIIFGAEGKNIMVVDIMGRIVFQGIVPNNSFEIIAMGRIVIK